MKKYIMILIIILGVICCDLAFCQLDKSVLIIHYGDVNYYAENENGFCSKPDCAWYEPCVYIKMWR